MRFSVKAQKHLLYFLDTQFCECFSRLSLIPKHIEKIYWGLKRHYASTQRKFSILSTCDWQHFSILKVPRRVGFQNVVNHCLCSHFHLKWSSFQFGQSRPFLKIILTKTLKWEPKKLSSDRRNWRRQWTPVVDPGVHYQKSGFTTWCCLAGIVQFLSPVVTFENQDLSF